MMLEIIGLRMMSFWLKVREQLMDKDVSEYLLITVVFDIIALGYLAYLHIRDFKRESEDEKTRAKEFEEKKEELDQLFDEINSVESQPPQFYHQVYMKKLNELIKNYDRHEYKKSIYESNEDDEEQSEPMSDEAFAAMSHRANYRLDKKELVKKWSARREFMNIVEWAKRFTLELEALWKIYGIDNKNDEKHFFEPVARADPKPSNYRAKLELDDNAEVCCVNGYFVDLNGNHFAFFHVPIDSKEMERMLSLIEPVGRETANALMDKCRDEFKRRIEDAQSSNDKNSKSEENE